MTKPSRAGRAGQLSSVCADLERLLASPCRRRWLDELTALPPADVLPALRTCMCDHEWTDAHERIKLRAAIADLDDRTRHDGFHALHDWDGIAETVNAASIPIDVLDFLGRQRPGEPCDRAALAILIDYYFLYLLALLSLRVWDGGDADGQLARLDGLLAALQGPEGSGQRFVEDAASLILLATSHYELEERGFLPLLERVRTLSPSRLLAVAIGHAAAMGCHLRFGFEATYGRSLTAMRDDNVADYPWLGASLLILMREYAARCESGADPAARRDLVEAIVSGLSADPGAFLERTPLTAAWPDAADAHEFSALVARYRGALVDDADASRPGKSYSPLSFLFNFSQNVLKGMVIDSLLWGESSPVTLNDMLRAAGGPAGEARLKMAAALERYARARPHRIRGQLLPVIVYDPGAGRHAFARTMAALRET
jgi:hypothetical protein